MYDWNGLGAIRQYDGLFHASAARPIEARYAGPPSSHDWIPMQESLTDGWLKSLNNREADLYGSSHKISQRGTQSNHLS